MKEKVYLYSEKTGLTISGFSQLCWMGLPIIGMLSRQDAEILQSKLIVDFPDLKIMKEPQMK